MEGCVEVPSELHTDAEEGCVEVPSELHTDAEEGCVEVPSELHTDVEEGDVEEGCVEVPSELHTDLQQFNMSVGDRMDRFIQLFWEEQEKTFKLENRGMRWHPTIINFAIFIRQQSPCVYHCMRDMGILKLPIEYDWLNHVRCFFSGECK